jgi:hypothetical protein
VTVVCGALHLPRVRFYFGGVYPRHGIRWTYARTRQLPTPRRSPVSWSRSR